MECARPALALEKPVIPAQNRAPQGKNALLTSGVLQRSGSEDHQLPRSAEDLLSQLLIHHAACLQGEFEGTRDDRVLRVKTPDMSFHVTLCLSQSHTLALEGLSHCHFEP